MNRELLDRLFRPTSVAVIGASTEPRKLGHRIVRSLVEAGFVGSIYPVHPLGGTIPRNRVSRRLRKADHCDQSGS
ncbi:MAG: hypothetical protein FJ295_13830 [Planctomycetes bacterium]|nr:hypothetical protein [Planctomycetota bacterium]